jgi:small ligand-binding sensory domain FIST
VALTGDLIMDTIVAQGCRPVGMPLFITRSRGNLILELDGRPPVDLIEELHASLSESDRALMRHSLFLGLAAAQHRQSYHRGDFLIRNLLGVDADQGALAVAGELRSNEVVQFQLRDASTSAEDLIELLQVHDQTPSGALLFSCLGRGVNLYGRSGHDSDLFRRRVGPVPLGGFFCNGEIGPVQGQTRLHTYTSCFGLFRPRGG